MWLPPHDIRVLDLIAQLLLRLLVLSLLRRGVLAGIAAILDDVLLVATIAPPAPLLLETIKVPF